MPDLLVKVDTHNGIVEGAIGLIDPAVRNGSVRVDVNFKTALPNGVRPDLSVDGRIVLGNLRDVVSIGRPAMATPNGSGTLFVLGAGSDVAYRKRIVYGAASSDRIVVVEGVAPGQQVILSDMSRWNEYEAMQLK